MQPQATTTSTHLPDRQLGWVERLPLPWRDYALLARLDRPIGTWLLLLPCWWGLTLGNETPDWWLMLMAGIGAVAMRGAGCTINDLTDRDFDRLVARTANRPLAAGRLGTREALAFIALQTMIGALCLFEFSLPAILVGIAGLPLIVIYPWMKRITWWPQAFLGLTFNWGVLLGAAAIFGSITPAALLLYAAGIAWTLGYDTIYAHQDKEDDALVGVRSTARLLGAATPAYLWGFYGVALILLAVAGGLAGKGPGFWLLLPVIAWSLARQIQGLQLDEPMDCIRRFRMNRLTGLLVTAAMIAGIWTP